MEEIKFFSLEKEMIFSLKIFNDFLQIEFIIIFYKRRINFFFNKKI
ncbi:MAG: hypothetical protein ACFYJC_01015 [Candidatus Karelsulcia muelleri]